MHIYCLASHCVISQQGSHECCCCCCCCSSWPCQIEMHYSLQSTVGSMSHTLPASSKVQQQQQCSSWVFVEFCVHLCFWVSVCVNQAAAKGLEKEGKKDVILSKQVKSCICSHPIAVNYPVLHHSESTLLCLMVMCHTLLK